MLNAIIIAGGSGKRLWPMSVKQRPKFFLKVKGQKTLLEQAVDRAKAVMPVDNVLIITSSRNEALVRKIMPRFPVRNIISEPVSRNTAPAIGLGAAIIEKRDPGGILFVLPADQVIEDTNAIKKIFISCALAARARDCIVTIGITPNFAATGYGYIKQAGPAKGLSKNRGHKIFDVECFMEKPDAKKARAFVKSGRYLWNSGIFAGRARVFLNELKTHAPLICRLAVKIAESEGTARFETVLKNHYRFFQDISIDYAVMEKTEKALVIKAKPGWSDIGSWNAFKKYIGSDKDGNSISAEHIGLDTRDSIIIGKEGHFIATAGVKGLVVVQTEKATLICAKGKAEDVKLLVDIAVKKGLKRYV
jgi:mannose-1-phosphate guanylyltransferase